MNVGGTARYITELVEKIPNSCIATGHVQQQELEDPGLQKFDVLRIPHLGRKVSIVDDFRAWLELRALIRELKPTIVHTHTFKAGLVGRLVGGTHKRIHTFHGHLFDDQSFSILQKTIIKAIERFLARRTDLLISVGKRVGEELRNQGIGKNKDWVSIAPGVEALPTYDQNHARKSLDLPADGILVGWMARMAEVKNPYLLLKIANRMTHVNFVMAGGGTLFEVIKKDAPENVFVIGWADAGKFWSAVDLSVSTSDNEGMPIALIEAQLAGIPVIATDVGSNAEVIADQITGFVTAKNAKALVESIQTLIENSALMKKMGTAAKQRSEEEFSLKKMINSHISAYSKYI